MSYSYDTNSVIVAISNRKPLSVILKLIDSVGDINSFDKNTYTAFISSARRSKENINEIMNALIKKGANVNAIDRKDEAQCMLYNVL